MQSQGRYKQALTFAEKALSIGKNVLGATDPQVANLLDNLASIYMSQKMFIVAEGYYEQALAIRESAFGSNHQDVAASYNQLAVPNHSQKNTYPPNFYTSAH